MRPVILENGISAIPKDAFRQIEFLLGKREKSSCEGFPCYVGDVLHAVKWRNWKVHYVWQEYMFDSPQPLPNPRVINLLDNPKERHVGGTFVHGSIFLSTRSWPIFKPV